MRWALHKWMTWDSNVKGGLSGKLLKSLMISNEVDSAETVVVPQAVKWR